MSRKIVWLPGNSKDPLVAISHEFKVRTDSVVLYFPSATVQLQVQSRERGELNQVWGFAK